MKYSQYKDFYDQSFTIPFKLLKGTKINGKMFLTALGIVAISFFIVAIIFPSRSNILGVPKMYIIPALTGLLLYLSTKLDTANYPFFIFIASLIQFSLKKFHRKTFVCFSEVNTPVKKIKYKWQIPYRDIIDTGTEVLYRMYPLRGIAKSLKGFSFSVQGATKILYNPITQTLKIKVGRFEILKEQEKAVGKYLPLKLETGRGDVKFINKKGKVFAKYTPER